MDGVLCMSSLETSFPLDSCRDCVYRSKCDIKDALLELVNNHKELDVSGSNCDKYEEDEEHIAEWKASDEPTDYVVKDTPDVPENKPDDIHNEFVNILYDYLDYEDDEQMDGTYCDFSLEHVSSEGQTLEDFLDETIADSYTPTLVFMDFPTMERFLSTELGNLRLTEIVTPYGSIDVMESNLLGEGIYRVYSVKDGDEDE